MYLYILFILTPLGIHICANFFNNGYITNRFMWTYQSEQAETTIVTPLQYFIILIFRYILSMYERVEGNLMQSSSTNEYRVTIPTSSQHHTATNCCDVSRPCKKTCNRFYSAGSIIQSISKRSRMISSLQGKIS